MVVALFTGLLQGLVGLVAGITMEQFWILLAVNVGAGGLLYLKSHPVDAISFETTRLTKDDVAGVTTSQTSKTTVTTESSKQ